MKIKIILLLLILILKLIILLGRKSVGRWLVEFRFFGVSWSCCHEEISWVEVWAVAVTV